jgi:tetratricopeptide (TPR) repeat protein
VLPLQNIEGVNSTTSTHTPKFRLGELIVELGLIKSEDLDYVLSIASETSLPVGRVLVMSNYVTEVELKNVLRCQTLLKEGLIQFEQGKKAIELTTRHKLDLDEALYRIGWNPAASDQITLLGDLMVDANFITQEQLQKALEQQAKTRLPLGRILVLAGVISEALLTTAVNAQLLVREKKLTRPQAIESLKHAKNRQVQPENRVTEKGFYELPKRAAPRLGELLTAGGIISENELINSLETSLVERKPIGQVLIEHGVITRDMLESALQIQRMIAESRISLPQAKAALLNVRKGKSLEEALQEAGSSTVETPASSLPLVTVLKLFGCVDEASLSQAFTVAQNNSQVISQVLLIGGILDEATLMKAERCRQLVECGRLTVERAGIVFDYSQRRSIDIPSALKELQWQHGSEPRERKPLVANKPVQYTRTEWMDLRESASKMIARGDYHAAREILKKLLIASQHQQDDRYGGCLDAIAESYLLEGDLHAAEEYYKSSLEHKLDGYGRDNLVVAFAVNNMGKVAYFQKRYDEAEKYAREFIRICAVALSANHPHVACGWQNVATICHVQNNFQAAEHAYRIAIQICSQSLGESHPTTVRVKRNYANLLHQMNKIADARGVDSFAQNSISGNWRVIDVPSEQALYQPDVEEKMDLFEPAS